MAEQISDTHDEASRILRALPARICEVVQPWAERSPDRLALVEAAGSWTYRQLREAIADTSIWLQSLGVRPGDRVMIVGENCRAFAAILLALTNLDAWPVLVNARLSTREIDEILDHCGARRVIYTTSVSPQAKSHALVRRAAITDTAALGTIGIGPLNQEVQPEHIDSDSASRVAALIYTSGTTGLPKGVMLTHRNLLFAAASSAKIRALSPDDRIYGTLPMSHVAGVSVALLGPLLSGTAIHVSPRFDPTSVFKGLEQNRLTVILGAPSMFTLLIEYARLKGLTCLKSPGLRLISCCGAPLHPATKLDIESFFGLTVQNAYGVTECSPNIAQTTIELPRADTSVGKPIPGVEVKLVGRDGNPVAVGEVGEMWVRGPNVMKGYYRAQEETAAAIDAEGWFNTRDLARLVDGNLFVVGRTKDMIVRSGFNVYPAEVEAVLNAHPAVARSAVIGRTVKGDEEVIAFIQPVSGWTIAAGELAEHAARQLAPYKRPSAILFVPAMPLTASGKIIKDELAKMVGSSAQA